MTVSRQGKRAIVFQGRTFLWQVTADDEFFAPSEHDHAVSVISSDGLFYIRFHLGQLDAARSHLSLRLRRHEGRDLVGRFRCPPFLLKPVTPRGVGALLSWALDPDTRWLPVNYLGYPHPSPAAE